MNPEKPIVAVPPRTLLLWAIAAFVLIVMLLALSVQASRSNSRALARLSELSDSTLNLWTNLVVDARARADSIRAARDSAR